MRIGSSEVLYTQSELGLDFFLFLSTQYFRASIMVCFLLNFQIFQSAGPGI